MKRTDYVAEVQMSYKVERQKPYSEHKITQARDSVDYIRIWFEQNNFSIEYREYFGVVYLNRRHNILGFNLISVGGVNGTVADPKLVFQGALLTNASELIIFHNHPSGNTNPSHADVLLTKMMKEAGKVTAIDVLDHIIVTSDSFYSFADERGMI